jgi:hypothetical protein
MGPAGTLTVVSVPPAASRRTTVLSSVATHTLPAPAAIAVGEEVSPTDLVSPLEGSIRVTVRPSPLATQTEGDSPARIAIPTG